MSERIAVEEQRRPVSGGKSCRHHWIVETPQGATSRGVCKRCGASKRFPNAAEDARWEAGRANLGRWSGRRGATGPAEISLHDSVDDA